MARRVHRVLIIDDSLTVRRYASNAFKDFKRAYASNPEDAREVVYRHVRQYGKNPFHLISCDINMAHRKNTVRKSVGLDFGEWPKPTGLEIMNWLHQIFPQTPIICHSDDALNAKKVPFAHFVQKTYIEDEEFNFDEALLRGRALELLDGKKSFQHVVYQARRMNPIQKVEKLKIAFRLLPAVTVAKKTQDFSKLFTVAQAGYITEKTLRDILRFCLAR